ncbi:hypothetical protein [Sinomonas sp. RB5]
MDPADVARIWHRNGSSFPANRLSLYAHALVAHRPIGPYQTLDDEQEDRVILALFRVDRPRATFEDLHQAPALALSSYHQLLQDLAREGFGPYEPTPAQASDHRLDPKGCIVNS